ncbi:MAG: ABC transporter ATP-binding protein [Clostridia bacterium]|nr:ABC transporter ATP-binding protein [Clostridia bacterium]
MAKRFLSYTKGYRFLSLICPIMIFIDVQISLQIPKVMGEVITLLYSIDPNGGATEAIREQLFGHLIKMLLLCAFTLCVGYIAARCSSIASMGFGANLRRELFYKIQSLSFENIDKLKISSLITRMTNDVSSIQNVYSQTIVIFIKGPFMLVSALVEAIKISTDLSVIFYVALPSIVVILTVMAIMAVPLFKKMLKATDRFNGTLRGNINGIRVVKSFVRENYEKDKFHTVNTEVMALNVKAQKIVLLISPAIMVVIYGCLIFSMIRGSRLIIEDTGMEIGQLSAFTSYITQVLSSFMTILMVFISMIMAKASIDRIAEVFKEEPSINDNGADESLKVKDGSIEFRNVTFKYHEDAVKNALEDINIRIEAGETVGIIGATGASKSTLIQLIPRIYDATQGEVFIGGENVKNYTFKNLRSEIAVVLQENLLFSGSIKENIRWGRLDATDEEVEKAAKAAEAHSFITEFEKGYDTDLSQGGRNVSGGQRQRICIARALVRKPKVLIFDDCTSAVDTATDAKIRASLRGEDYKDITKLIIAQRITSIMDADRIIVIDGGKIDSVGTHEELLTKSEIYHEIFVSQQEGVLAQ